MALWQVQINGSYVDMKTPSSFKLDANDLDSNSYRSVSNGNLIRTILGKKWLSAEFSYNYLTQQELEQICSVLNLYPMKVKFKSPMFSTDGIWTGQVYCSKWSVNMQQNKDNGATWNQLTFTLVQSSKGSGQ